MPAANNEFNSHRLIFDCIIFDFLIQEPKTEFYL